MAKRKNNNTLLLKEQLNHTLTKTQFDFLGKQYVGKVRDSYTRGDIRYLIATDRLSCFDVVVTTIPCKGQVLTQLAHHWFLKTEHIIKNHVIDLPDPNVMVVKNAEVLPIEVVVRGYLAGSSWRDYTAGKAISGIMLPPGMKQHQKFDVPLLTPSTKAPQGDHDMPISEQEILAQGIVSPTVWARVREVALALFELGQKEADKAGLILVDTKYELGLIQGEVVLVDEIHTLDSSRYWLKSNYGERFAAGESPQMLDKEPTRQWLLSKGYKGEGVIPEFTDQHRLEIAQHYIGAFEQITQREFTPRFGDIESLVGDRLKAYAVR
jgi:phosphoribosylaminoimidazole-succinocarboxamide synthase